MNMDNDGWIKSTDSTTGRTFYANKHTRTTQWEAPDGWSDNAAAAAANSDVHMLPEGWEEATDPKSGKTFYINHLERKTTWDRPSPTYNSTASSSTVLSTPFNSTNDYTNLNTLTINKYGSHSKWVDPSKGSRYGSSRIHTGIMDNNDQADCEPPLLEFSTVQVPDSLRPTCPSCHAVFTTLKRRHHCRLCGDVYCDGCSAGRAVLPLEGEEFSRSVRVCDLCLGDVKRGNYFTWRRYLTPLQLYIPHKLSKSNQDTQDAITIDIVAASLSSLSVDLDAILSNPQNLKNQVSISANVLVPAVGRHLSHRKSSEYAIRVLASLVTLGNVVGDDSFALAIHGLDMDTSREDKMKHVRSYNSMVSMSSEESRLERTVTRCNILDGVLSILEWGGSDGRTVGAQEQAAKIIFYVTDPTLAQSALSKATADEDIVNIDSTNDRGPVDVDAPMSTEVLLDLDVHRAFRAMFDHATSSSSTTLQRWATASLRNLITEDQRRATLFSSGSTKYQTFISQLVSTGGIMILCSLMASDDSDTRVHAASALEGIVLATREIEVMLNESGRQYYRVGRGTKADSEIVNAIVSNGGFGYSLAQLLISSDEAVAMAGCGFALSLMTPLLTDPKGTSQILHICTSSASSGMILEMNDDLNCYRHAALALVIGDDDNNSKGISCLPSLIQIMRRASDQSYPSRSIQLQICATKCMASVALAVCSVVGAANSRTISTNSPLYQQADKALKVMESERVYEVALRIATSSSLNSLDPSRSTPNAQLKEAAGLVLFAVATSSHTSAKYLLSNRTVSAMLRILSDTEILSAPSMIRGNWASRGLCYLEAAAALLIHACKYPVPANDSYMASSLDPLNEAIDSDAISLTSKVLKAKVNLQKQDFAYSQIRVKIACCYMLSAMFEISSDERNASGKSRLYSAIDADCAAFVASNNGIDSRSSRLETTAGRSDLVASTIALLRATLPSAQKVMNDNSSEPLPMVDLSEACLLAVGGMCGANPGFFDAGQSDEDVTKYENDGEGMVLDKFMQDACRMALDALKMNIGDSKLLPVVLVGALGEACIVPMLRLSHAVAINGVELCVGLIRVGILNPLSDLFKSSMSAGNFYAVTICIAIVRHCGSAAKNIDATSFGSLTESIRTVSSMLSSDLKFTNLGNNARRLQRQCIEALGAIASNEFLSNVMSTIALPVIITSFPSLAADSDDSIICLALDCVTQLVTNPKNAAMVAKGGFVSNLVELAVSRSNSVSPRSLSKTPAMTLKVLHQLSLHGSQIRHSLMANGVVNLLTQILEIHDLSGDETRSALETLSLLITDEFRSSELEEYLIREVASKSTFIRRLIATMLAHEQQENSIDIPSVHETTYPATEFTLAIRLLVQIAWLLCSDYGSIGRLLEMLLFQDLPDSSPIALYTCCSLLCILQNDTYTEGRSMLTVRTFLVEAISVSLKECMPTHTNQAEEILVLFQVPQMCLIMCQKEDAAPEAFDLFGMLISLFGSTSIGEQLLAEKSFLIALLDIVTIDNGNTEVFARLLGDLASDGVLSNAIVGFGLRSRAIAALTAAIVSAENSEGVIDEDETSLSRICIDCLTSILLSNEKGQVEMKPLEAAAVISTIGRTLASTVLHRFFIQASREASLSIDNTLDRINIKLSSEARLLCAAASSAESESLEKLNGVGGLDAISLIAHDGDIAAIQALARATEMDPSTITAIDAHLSVLDVMCSMEEKLISNSNHDTLRVIMKHCVSILTMLAGNNLSRSTILNAEKSLEAMDVALQFVVAMSKVREKMLMAESKIDSTSVDTTEDAGCGANVDSSTSMLKQDCSVWETFVPEGDFSLGRAIFSLMLAFLPSKPHRSHLANDNLINAIIELVLEESATFFDVQCDAVELIESFTKYSLHSRDLFATSLVSVIEKQTKVIQGTRDIHQLFVSKKIVSSAASGLQNLLCTAINDDLKVKAIAVSSDLFVYLVDSLFVGPKSKRLAVKLEDGMLVSNLTSLFLLANCNEELRHVLLSSRHVSSMLRFIMMASGIDSSIVLASNEGSDYLDSAMEFCLISLSYMANESSQSKMENQLVELIQNVEHSPGAFVYSLEHLSSEKSFGGALRVIAMKLLTDIQSTC